MEKDLVNAISYVSLSKYRQKVLLELEDNLKIPSAIAKATNIRISHVSRTLKGLKEKKLVECLNEEANQGRIYRITDKGKKVLKYIE